MGWNIPADPGPGGSLPDIFVSDVIADLEILESQVGLYAYANPAAGSPPGTSQPSFLAITAAPVFTATTGGQTISYPSGGFPNGSFWPAVGWAEKNSNGYTVGVSSVTASGFKVSVYNGSSEITSGSFSIAYVVFGF